MNHVSYVLSPVKRVSCVGFPEIYVGGGNKHSVFFPLGRRAPKLGPNVHVMGHRTWENKHKPMATPTNLIRCLEEMCTHGYRCRWICTLLLSQRSKELPSTRGESWCEHRKAVHSRPWVQQANREHSLWPARSNSQLWCQKLLFLASTFLAPRLTAAEPKHVPGEAAELRQGLQKVLNSSLQAFTRSAVSRCVFCLRPRPLGSLLSA